MSNKTVKYTTGDVGRVRVIEDFLPSPEHLVPRETNVKVTLSLSRRSLDFTHPFPHLGRNRLEVERREKRVFILQADSLSARPDQRIAGDFESFVAGERVHLLNVRRASRRRRCIGQDRVIGIDKDL